MTIGKSSGLSITYASVSTPNQRKLKLEENGSCRKPQRKEKAIEATVSEEKETTIQERKSGGRKWGSLIFKFLMYGGWLLVAIAALAIFFLVSILRK